MVWFGCIVCFHTLMYLISECIKLANFLAEKIEKILYLLLKNKYFLDNNPYNSY